MAWRGHSSGRGRVEFMDAETSADAQEPLSRSVDSRRDLRPQQPWPTNRLLRILSLDGGGLKGLFAVRLLSRIEQEFNLEGKLHQYFDYIAGTSTGAIIGLGIAAGIPARSIEELYVRYGPVVFPTHLGFVPRRHLQLLWHPYRSDKLEQLLDEAFGEKILGECLTRVCVPTCDGRLGETWIYKTPHHVDFKKDWLLPIAQIARATSAAPTYLKPLQERGYVFLDGGLFANNPVMVAIADALSAYSVDRRMIQTLSIGSGGKRPLIGGLQTLFGGSMFWATKVADTMIEFSSQNAIGQSMLLLGADHIVRVTPDKSLWSIAMDDFNRVINELLPDADRAFHDNVGTISRFFEDQVEPPLFWYGPRANAS